MLNFHQVLFSLFQLLSMKMYSRVYFSLCLFLAISGRSRTQRKLNPRENFLIYSSNSEDNTTVYSLTWADTDTWCQVRARSMWSRNLSSKSDLLKPIGVQCYWRTSEIMQCQATATLRRPQIKQDICSKGGLTNWTLWMVLFYCINSMLKSIKQI